MKNIFLFYFAVMGWTLGLIIHLLSIADLDVQDKVPFIWLLHIGIFVVFIPAILKLRKNKELTAFEGSGFVNRLNAFKHFKIVFKNTPSWIVMIVAACFVYGFISFSFLMLTHPGTPHFENGIYSLMDHGTLIRTITEKEFHHYQANEIRGFSGHWLIFYGFAAAVLYPFKNASDIV